MSAPDRRRLLCWGSWFAVANAGVAALVGVRYLSHYAAPTLSVAWLYVVIACVGHWAALAYLPFLLLVPVIMLVPRPGLVLSLGVSIAAVGLSLLLLDSLVFAENRYHLSLLMLPLLSRQTWAFVGVYLVSFLAIDAMLATWIWRRSARPPTRRSGRALALGLGSCFLASHAAYVWADAVYYVPVTSFTHSLPLYFRFTAATMLTRAGFIDRQRALELAAERDLTAAAQHSDAILNYPLVPLRCDTGSPLNVLLVVVDAMRADVLTPAIAPNLSAFADRAIRFDQHWSGGNSSRAGMFSLFYGLPATYWQAFAGVGRQPVLIDAFQASGYQLGLFGSAKLNRAVGLERTAFARVSNLRLGSTARSVHGRDRMVTDEWLAWLERWDPARPFFGFLYYDAAQAEVSANEYWTRYAPPAEAGKRQRQYARYTAAVHYVDTEAGRVLGDLERRGLLERTVVVVTSDHGAEFNENGAGFYGHGTSYSPYQLHTPLVVYWPGRPTGRVEHRTSHHDLAPTLLAHVFGCSNPPADYSSGHDLFSDARWDWLVAASYTDFALVEPERVTIAYPSGLFEVRDRDYRIVSSLPSQREVLEAALHEMSRFYR